MVSWPTPTERPRSRRRIPVNMSKKQTLADKLLLGWPNVMFSLVAFMRPHLRVSEEGAKQTNCMHARKYDDCFNQRFFFLHNFRFFSPGIHCYVGYPPAIRHEMIFDVSLISESQEVKQGDSRRHSDSIQRSAGSKGGRIDAIPRPHHDGCWLSKELMNQE